MFGFRPLFYAILFFLMFSVVCLIIGIALFFLPGWEINDSITNYNSAVDVCINSFSENLNPLKKKANLFQKALEHAVQGLIWEDKNHNIRTSFNKESNTF